MVHPIGARYVPICAPTREATASFSRHDVAHWKSTHRSIGEQMNILVATDGSESAIDAARRSMDLLRPGAHVVLVAVIPEYEDPME